jgi:hypothetical protein
LFAPREDNAVPVAAVPVPAAIVVVVVVDWFENVAGEKDGNAIDDGEAGGGAACPSPPGIDAMRGIFRIGAGISVRILFRLDDMLAPFLV